MDYSSLTVTLSDKYGLPGVVNQSKESWTTGRPISISIDAQAFQHAAMKDSPYIIAATPMDYDAKTPQLACASSISKHHKMYWKIII